MVSALPLFYTEKEEMDEPTCIDITCVNYSENRTWALKETELQNLNQSYGLQDRYIYCLEIYRWKFVSLHFVLLLRLLKRWTRRCVPGTEADDSTVLQFLLDFRDENHGQQKLREISEGRNPNLQEKRNNSNRESGSAHVNERPHTKKLFDKMVFDPSWVSLSSYSVSGSASVISKAVYT